MINQFQKKILLLAVHAGEIMMKSGAEISRVEDTITRICNAGKISNVNVFATPTGIFVTMDEGSEDSEVFTYLRRIKGSSTDLSKISAVNRFSREFTSTDLSVESGMEILDEISAEKKYPLPARLLAAALVAGAFCMLFGGNIRDLPLAMIVGLLCYGFSRFLDKFETNFFIQSFCCCFAASFIALAAQGFGIASNPSSIIIGVVMIFVPGVAITNSLRDFMSGDMVAGLARLAEAIMIAVALAAGAGIMLKLWKIFGGVLIWH